MNSTIVQKAVNPASEYDVHLPVSINFMVRSLTYHSARGEFGSRTKATACVVENKHADHSHATQPTKKRDASPDTEIQKHRSSEQN